MQSRVLRFGFVSLLALVPVVACGDDPVSVVEDAAAPPPVEAAPGLQDAGPVDAAPVPVPDPVGPISVTLVIPQLPDGGVQAPDGGELPDSGPGSLVEALTDFFQPSVIFYPKESPDSPIVERVSFGQTVTKELTGAHLVFSLKFPASGEDGGAPALTAVTEADYVTPSETLTVEAPITFGGPGPGEEPPAPLPIRRKVTALPPAAAAGLGELTYRFSDCTSLQQITPRESDDAPEAAQLDRTCIDSDGKARFSVMVHSSTRGAVAIGTATVVVSPGGEPPLVEITQYTTSAPTPWAVTGLVPEGASVFDVRAFATQGDSIRGPVIGLGSLLGGNTNLSFVRPAPGFNDTEVRTLSALITAPDQSIGNHIVVTERSAPSAPVSTDIDGIVRFTSAAVVPTTSGSPRFDFGTSSVFPAETLLTATASGTTAAGETVRWSATSSGVGASHFGGLVLPETVREGLVGSGVTWQLDALGASTGIAPRVLRARSAAEASSGVALLPSGVVRVQQTVAMVPRP